MTDHCHATGLSTASSAIVEAVVAALATSDSSPEPEQGLAADHWLALPWPVANADERRKLKREMVLRALI